MNQYFYDAGNIFEYISSGTRSIWNLGERVVNGWHVVLLGMINYV